jgi:vacuolar-type H+-ATPase subunit C/Vma6
MILTEQQIETEVSKVKGTHVKRNNLRAKLKAKSNAFVNDCIELLRKEVRALKSQGAKQQELSPLFAYISSLENQIL